MQFNPHSDLEGRHAFLSASKYHWLGYDDEKLVATMTTRMAAQKGTALHDLAKTMIQLGVKLPNNDKTLNRYVNDAIGFRMTPEVILAYSLNAFGTTDAISFRVEKRGQEPTLRIHDLKTGITAANMKQLIVYVAYFCLEYGIRPGEINVVLRIYQNDEILEYIPDLDEIVHAMDKIKRFDRLIDQIREEMLA